MTAAERGRKKAGKKGFVTFAIAPSDERNNKENRGMISFSAGPVKISPTFEFEKPIGKCKTSILFSIADSPEAR